MYALRSAGVMCDSCIRSYFCFFEHPGWDNLNLGTWIVRRRIGTNTIARLDPARNAPLQHKHRGFSWAGTPLRWKRRRKISLLPERDPANGQSLSHDGRSAASAWFDADFVVEHYEVSEPAMNQLQLSLGCPVLVIGVVGASLLGPHAT